MSVEPPERTNVGWLGRSFGGTSFGERQCPDGAYINEFYGRAGGMLDQICAKCSDGTDLGCGYPTNGGNPFRVPSLLGWNQVYGGSGADVDSFLGQGGGGGRRVELTCPTGTRVVGYGGSFNQSGRFTQGLYMKCGVVAEDFCQDNLESKFCRNSVVDRRTLNAACAKNLTDTCRDRRQELTTSTVQKICKLNPDDPFCACFRPRPDYIPPEHSGNQQCWNTVCASQGYIPNPDFKCPDITICREDIKTSGNSNILTNNVQVSTCGSTNSVVHTNDPTKVSDKPINTINATPISDVSKTNWFAENWLLLTIFIIVLAIIYGTIRYIRNRNNDSSMQN